MNDRPKGKVYLVGGGPGDPGLLTLRGRQCLARAEVVLYDYLVNPRVLRHAATAELVCLGRHGRDRLVDQAEINARLVELARQGRVVVRLKGGDPAIFGHLAEEAAALQAASIEYEIVPGVTAASAAASFAGIPLTARDAASAVALVTGQQGHDEPAPLDYPALARFPGHVGLLYGRYHGCPLDRRADRSRLGGRHAGRLHPARRACPSNRRCARRWATWPPRSSGLTCDRRRFSLSVRWPPTAVCWTGSVAGRWQA